MHRAPALLTCAPPSAGICYLEGLALAMQTLVFFHPYLYLHPHAETAIATSQPASLLAPWPSRTSSSGATFVCSLLLAQYVLGSPLQPHSVLRNWQVYIG